MGVAHASNGWLAGQTEGRLGMRCVVLVQQAGEGPQALLDGLARRGVELRVVTSPAQVMVELAGTKRAVVIVDRVDSVKRFPQLLAAVKRYYPRVRCWRHTAQGPDGRPQLVRCDRLTTGPAHAGAVGEDDGADRRAPSSQPDHASVGRQMLTAMVDGSWSGGLRPERPEPENGRIPQPLLTEAELAMLMGRPFGDEPAQAGDGDKECSRP